MLFCYCIIFRARLTFKYVKRSNITNEHQAIYNNDNYINHAQERHPLFETEILNGKSDLSHSLGIIFNEFT